MLQQQSRHVAHSQYGSRDAHGMHATRVQMQQCESYCSTVTRLSLRRPCHEGTCAENWRGLQLCFALSAHAFKPGCYTACRCSSETSPCSGRPLWAGSMFDSNRKLPLPLITRASALQMPTRAPHEDLSQAHCQTQTESNERNIGSASGEKRTRSESRSPTTHVHAASSSFLFRNKCATEMAALHPDLKMPSPREVSLAKRSVSPCGPLLSSCKENKCWDGHSSDFCWVP